MKKPQHQSLISSMEGRPGASRDKLRDSVITATSYLETTDAHYSPRRVAAFSRNRFRSRVYRRTMVGLLWPV